MPTISRRVGPAALLVLALTLATACSSSSKPASTGTTPTTGNAGSGKVTLHLGYLPNVTHAPAIIGCRTGRSPRTSGRTSTLKTSTYNSGTDETTALLAGALDAAFVGPNPAINAYQKTGGQLIRIVSGVASGGAFLVVKPSITSPADLKGKKISTPSLGNTQDVALRTWLNTKGYKATKDSGGDVTILPQDNSATLTAFQSGAIDGAWVPEPYATQLQQEGGKVLVDEATLWPKGQFVTTNLVVTTKYLAAHPDVIANLLKGLDSSIKLVKTDPAEAQKLTAEGIGAVKGKTPSTSLIATSFKSITFTLDPIASSLKTDAAHAKALGFIDSTDLDEHLRPDAAQHDVESARQGGNHPVKSRSDENALLASGSVDTTGLEAQSRPVVSVAGVTKVFGTGSQQVVALEGVTLDIERGEFVCLLGASGCGKSTLLNLIAGLDQPTTGTVDVRAERTGLMFQEAALFPWLTVRGNVEIALRLAGVARSERKPARRRPARDGAPRRLRASGARTSCRVACASASRSPARSRRTPTCCSWTSRSVRSTP